MGQSIDSEQSKIQTTGDGIVDTGTETTESSGQNLVPVEGGENNASDGAKRVIKYPIFIGTAEPDIVKAIERTLFGSENSEALLSKNRYVLLVINQEVYKALHQQYLFTLLNEDEQSRAQQLAVNEELHQKALTQAMQIEYFIWNYDIETNTTKKSNLINENNHIVFSEPQLRVILNKMKHKAGEKGGISHADCWNVMDLLVVHGFLTVENVLEETKNREKRKWVLTVADKYRLDILKKQRNEMSYLQEKYHDQENALNNEIIALEQKIHINEKQKLGQE